MEKNLTKEQVDLKVDWCSYDAAKYAVEHWHYSKCLPCCKTVKIGIWENDKFIGVIIFSWGATSTLVKQYGLVMTEGCELTRVALNDHITQVSKLVSIAIKFLKNKNPGLKLIVSFADPEQNHVGTIYQAGNWIFTGITSKSISYYDKSGRKYHPRNVGYIKKRAILISPTKCRKVITDGKYRYLMPLNKKMRKQILPLSKPYPKRVKQAISDDQFESGGAEPTHTLQKTYGGIKDALE